LLARKRIKLAKDELIFSSLRFLRVWCLAFWALDHRAKVAVHLLCRLRFQLLTGVFGNFESEVAEKLTVVRRRGGGKSASMLFDS
jgi:hypothetical protein